MSSRRNRLVYAIGGHENKDGHPAILADIAKQIGSGKLVVLTVATQRPAENFREYQKIFSDLGIEHIEHIEIDDREAASDPAKVELLQGAKGVFSPVEISSRSPARSATRRSTNRWCASTARAR
jgi:cyanophycinase-like exopeptidase